MKILTLHLSSRSVVHCVRHCHMHRRVVRKGPLHRNLKAVDTSVLTVHLVAQPRTKALDLKVKVSCKTVLGLLQ